MRHPSVSIVADAIPERAEGRPLNEKTTKRRPKATLAASFTGAENPSVVPSTVNGSI
jgi:hypothetical protein